MTIKEWQRAVYSLAKEKGFRDEGLTVWIMLGNLHAEISEAWEEARRPDFDPLRWRIRRDGKPEGFPSEIADIAIRLLDLAEHYGIDVEDAIKTKHAYNKTRAFRHGGKRC